MPSQLVTSLSPLQSIPQVHRAATLQAIAQKAHAIDSRIEFLRVQGEKTKQAIDGMPEDVNSRLSWLAQNLNA